VEVVALPFEELVLAETDDDIKVAARQAEVARLPFSSQPQP
jgi:hypothetical protein